VLNPTNRKAINGVMNVQHVVKRSPHLAMLRGTTGYILVRRIFNVLKPDARNDFRVKTTACNTIEHTKIMQQRAMKLLTPLDLLHLSNRHLETRDEE